MTKIKNYCLFILLMLPGRYLFGQQTYTVVYKIADSARHKETDLLQTKFSTGAEATDFISKLPQALKGKGYITASIDSVQFDSLSAQVQLYLGAQYTWTKLHTQTIDADILEAIRWNTDALRNTSIPFTELQNRQQQVLTHLEETGYPFAKIYLDSIRLIDNEAEARLQIYRGPLYKIDSIRVYGDAKVSNLFLQRYLNIFNGSIYSKPKLKNVSKKLSELAFLEEEKPSDLTLSGAGSVLNLYLKTVRNSQVNALLGFLPNPTVGGSAKGFRVSGEANILLRNALSSGETIGVTAQFLQAQSPRLNLLYEQPYIFRSAFGLRFNFDMFKKDSTFLNVNFWLGANYGAGEAQSGALFIQRSQSLVSGIDAAQVLLSKQLPAEGDVSSTSLGVIYEYNNTDYRLNPQKGNELNITTSTGTKQLKKNNQVLELKDANSPTFKYESLYDTVKLKTYQLRVAVAAAHYFKSGRQGTLKTAVQGGLFSSGNIFRNEAFRIGGYRLLRGFDEESQYVSQYGVGTLEYRILLQRNSNFFAFVDGGWGKHVTRESHTYLGTGLGISSETKAGIFNLVWAVGKRDDTEFNLRQSKVHLGFINYF
jgi:outer membrane protein assembly factor BamA